jgi:hypothetical protein
VEGNGTLLRHSARAQNGNIFYTSIHYIMQQTIFEERSCDFLQKIRKKAIKIGILCRFHKLKIIEIFFKFGVLISR